MKSTLPSKYFASLMALLLLTLLVGGSVPSARADNRVREDFSQTGNGRTSGETLNGTTPPGSSLHWICKSNSISFAGTKDDAYATINSKDQSLAYVELPSDGNEIEMDATVQPTGKGWIALGMGKPKSDLDNCWADGLFLLLNSSGGFQVFIQQSGAMKEITGGSQLPNYIEDGMNTIKLLYDKKTRMLNCYVNERPVARNINLEKMDFTPDLSFAGISSYGVMPHTKSIGSFSLSVR